MLKCEYQWVQKTCSRKHLNLVAILSQFMYSDLHGEDNIAITNSQRDKLLEENQGKICMTTEMSKTQLAYNMKIERRFLPALAGLILFLTGTVLPALGVGALSELASTGVQKLIGNGLYLKKSSGLCRIETYLEGLSLGPVNGDAFETVRNGLYLMKQDGLYDGGGLILCPNSPFKNIPIHGMIL